MFSWQEQYLTSERSKRVRYCSCHENMEFISPRHRVISSISLPPTLLERDREKVKQTKQTKGKMTYHPGVKYLKQILMQKWSLALNYVPVKSKLQHSLPGKPRAFDVFSCPGRREFDHHS